MKAEAEVRKKFPDAKIEWLWLEWKFRVTIKPGRYAYGLLKSWAWEIASDYIQLDEATEFLLRLRQ